MRRWVSDAFFLGLLWEISSRLMMTQGWDRDADCGLMDRERRDKMGVGSWSAEDTRGRNADDGFGVGQARNGLGAGF